MLANPKTHGYEKRMIHYTLSHQFKNVFFLSRFDYSVRGSRAERFYEEIRKYYPSLKDGSLQSGYAGIRPKLTGPRQTPADFVIQVISKHIILNDAYPMPDHPIVFYL